MHPRFQQRLAEQYRTAQSRTILDLFAGAHGRPAQSMQELEEWVASPEGKATLAPHRGRDGKIKPTYRKEDE